MRESRLLIPALSSAFVAALIAACSGGSSTNANPDPTTTDQDAGVITTPTVDGGNCGHNTTPCPTGAKCKVAADCIKADVCTSGVCNVPPASCGDGSKDGDETDLDCGGSCPPCADGKTCTAPTDCVNAVCMGTCQGPSCTDKLPNGNETGVDCGGGMCPKCTVGGGCKTGADCDTASCGKDNLCAAATSTDGIKNGSETDIDCGGGAPTNAPTCAVGKKCGVGPDCFWGHCNAGVCGDHVVGTKDGDETDINCGGTKSPACDWYKGCLVDKDCTTNACDTGKHCAVGPSCKSQIHGGSTCGLNEFDPDPMDPKHNLNLSHETCCKSLPVNGYTDPVVGAGKTVYVDKYEITAGRMRAFVNYVSGLNGNVPAIRSYTAAHRPSRWNNGWEEALPDANAGSAQTYTIKNPTINLLYPGQDQYSIPGRSTQTSWWVGDAGGAYGNPSSHDFTVDNGLFYAVSSNSNFPEYYAGAGWPSIDYSVYHSQNCSNGDESFGLATYWFNGPTTRMYSGGTHDRAFTQDILDEKTLNCTPNALFAAFCAWDGGQLATAEVMDAITGNTLSPVYDGTAINQFVYQNGKLAPGQSQCHGAAGDLVTYGDGASGLCYAYYYPDDMGKNHWDGTARIAPPGRAVADSINKAGDAAGTEPWMDMIGNMHEAVLKKAETARFDYRGYGTEYNSIQHHKNQQTTPRFKSGAMGARCMRFK